MIVVDALLPVEQEDQQRVSLPQQVGNRAAQRGV